MKYTIILFLFILVPFKIFSQDPNCEFLITLKSIDENKYSYKIIIEFDFEKRPIDSLKMSLKRVWNDWQSLDSAILKTDTNKKIIVGYLSDYCYPRWENTDQLRIIIARKRKKDNKIELMYSSSQLIAQTPTEIIIEKFKNGKRKSEIFVYDKGYEDNAPFDQRNHGELNLKKRKIYLN